MARPFDFEDGVKKQARLRQFGLCAVCGDSMNDLYEHAHHVVPNQSGNVAISADSWLKGEDNCVILCEDCHFIVHDGGRYQKGAVAPPDYYKYSHGGHVVAHVMWVSDMNLKIKLFWP